MTPLAATARLVLPVGERDHILGPATAPMTLVEYGDYECPHCGRAHHIVSALLEHLGDQVRFVFRHFPLATIHPHAQNAAEAAESAGARGRFWEMHDVLFENQDVLDDESLVQYAVALGHDPRRFIGELANHVHAPRVREDFLSGARSGVNGTPAFFINGVRHDGDFDLDTLLDAIAFALERRAR